MSFENLKARALAVYDQKVKQLKILRSLGINGLSIGVESGDDSTLALANKGYTAKDIIEQCRKLDEAGIEYFYTLIDDAVARVMKSEGGYIYITC